MTPAMDPKKFGQLIALYREKRGLTQGALARAAGISRPYLSQIESGNRLPGDDVMERLIVLSGVPMQEFVQVGPDMTDEQKQAAMLLLQPYDTLSQTLAPEQMLDLMRGMSSIEQMAGAMTALAGGEPPMPSGPEGWSDLNKEDRRLVQRLINRLRTTDLAAVDVREEGE